MKTTISVPDINCGHCTASIEGAVRGMPGVHSVVGEVESKTVELEYDGEAATLAAVEAKIEEQGFSVQRAG